MLTLSEFSIAVTGLLTLLFFSFRELIRTYSAKKGENLAMKEDLHNLTKIVESVKTDFQKEIEQVKANLVSEGKVIERRREIYQSMCLALQVFLRNPSGGAPKSLKDFIDCYNSSWLCERPDQRHTAH